MLEKGFSENLWFMGSPYRGSAFRLSMQPEGNDWLNKLPKEPGLFNVSRRKFLTAGAAAGAAALLPNGLRGIAASPISRPGDWYVPEADLPVLELDPRASIAKGRIMARGAAMGSLEWGAVIIVPAGADIPARWWGLRVGRQTNLQDGARIVLRGADPSNPSRLRAPGNEGVLELQNLSSRRILMQVADLEITAGSGGDAIRIDRVAAALLQHIRIKGGKMASLQPIIQPTF